MKRAELVAELRTLHAKVYGAEAEAESFADRYQYPNAHRSIAVSIAIASHNRSIAMDIDHLIERIEKRRRRRAA